MRKSSSTRSSVVRAVDYMYKEFERPGFESKLDPFDFFMYIACYQTNYLVKKCSCDHFLVGGA